MMLRRNKMMIFSLAVFLSVSLFNPHVNAEKRENTTPEMEFRVKGSITVNGQTFKDLNGNKKLDPYENWQLKDEDRVKDLISKMTLEEKAGLLLIPRISCI